jgi:hypothetical protein
VVAALAAGSATLAQAQMNDDDARPQQPANRANQPVDQGRTDVNRTDDRSDSQRSADDNARMAKLAAPQLPAGATAKQSADIDALNGTIANVASNALNKGNFSDIVDNFVDQDRNRIGDYADQDMTTLDGRIDQLRKAWENKYGDEYDFDKGALAGHDARQGEIQDPSAFATHWPVPVTSQSDAQQASGRMQGNVEGRSTPNNSQSNIEKGRDVAIVHVPGRSNLPALNLSLVNELGGWKLDIPNTRTGKQIHDDVLTHLTWLGENTSQWPADKTEAYRLVAHHVLMGIYGLPVPKSNT